MAKHKIEPIEACYAGKVVSMDYVPDPKMRFHLACCRITDNGARTGYVVEGGKVYRVVEGKRSAKILEGSDRESALAEIARWRDG